MTYASLVAPSTVEGSVVADQQSWAHDYAWLFPILLAIALLLAGPFLTDWANHLLDGQIAQEAIRHKVPTNAVIYPHVHPRQIRDYVEYAADLIQIIPGGLLPIAGVAFAIVGKIDAYIGLFLMFAIMVITIGLAIWVSKTPASVYVSRRVSKKWFLRKFSYGPAFSILLNLICIAVLLGFQWYSDR